MTGGPYPSYDILITSIPHRHGLLCELLAELGRQLPAARGEVGVLLYRDNLEHSYGYKTQVLIENSGAEYVSCVDDDDMVAPDFVARVTAALRDRPDYVGYPVRWTRDGALQRRVEHSLRYPGWGASDQCLERDISEKNPVRREIALLVPFDGGYGAEVAWAAGIRATGRCRTEAWIPDAMYYYRESTADTFQTARQPVSGTLPGLPAYPWLRRFGT
jgi:hypothetical protein